MKLYFYIALFFLSLSAGSQEISGELIYNVSFKKVNLDSIKLSKKKYSEESIKKAREIYSSARDVRAVLLFSDFESYYKVENKMANSIQKGINLTYIFAGSDNVNYVNNKKKEYLYTTNSLGENFIVKYEPKKWKLTQEKKKIGNYICYKAIDINSKNKKMKPIAWFTPEIPSQYGPEKFHGLPGLILELETASIIFKAQKIKLNPKNKIVINKPSKGKVITTKEYRKLIRKVSPF